MTTAETAAARPLPRQRTSTPSLLHRVRDSALFVPVFTVFALLTVNALTDLLCP